MNAAIGWFARNPVAANLMMAFIVVSGAMSAGTARKEVFPEIASGRISIDVPYLGAVSTEVEAGVVVRIEEAIQDIDGIRAIRSTASEGAASVVVELGPGVDARRVLDDINNQIDAIAAFPAETEEPIVRELTPRNQVIGIAVAGSVDRLVLKALAERMRDELTALPEVSQVDIVGAPPREISIEVSEVALRRHGMTFDQIADALRRSSLDLPGGSINTAGGEVLLRTVGQARRGDEYRNLTLWTGSDGSRLRLGDVATVVDGLADTDQYARFDGEPAVMLAVFRTGDQNVLEVADAVRAYVDRLRTRLPEGVSATVWRDRSQELQVQLSLMLSSGVGGLVLVFAALALFVEWRLALWVSLGIPVAFLGALALLPVFDVSISITSLFAFIVVLGIVVDDAIIVGENVHRRQEDCGDGLRGAVTGAREIAKPVVFAVLTTVAAFLPLLFVPGMMGSVFRDIPLVVIPCLLFSLVESLGILPAHLSHAGRPPTGGPWNRVQERFAGALRFTNRRLYLPLLGAALRWRYVTVAVGVALLVLTAGMMAGGWATVRFIPSVEDDFMVAAVTMPQSAPAAEVTRVVERLEDAAARLRGRLMQETGTDHLMHVSSAIGDQPMRAWALGALPGITSASNVGEVTVQLAPAETRSYTSGQLGGMWRAMTGSVPEAVAVEFDMSMLNAGADIDVQLAGRDLDRLRDAAEAVKRRLTEYAGVYEIADSFNAGKPEVTLGIQPSAETFGLTLQDLGRQVRQAFYGEEAQRIQRGRDDIRVMVRYPRDERRSLDDLENMRVRTLAGGEVPFNQVAQVEPGRGFATITRVNRNRAVNVTAAVDPAVTSASAVVTDLRERILPEVLAGHPGVFYTFEGFQAEQAEAVGGLQRGFAIALLAIFGLLAVPLRSYAQPLVIMAAIPFGLVGAVWGHMLLGLDVTVMSAFGLVALTGVVVNDSLVMIDAVNRARRAELSAGRNGPDSLGVSITALREAGARRFRPILLTSVTTFVGLAPLMFGGSAQAMFLVPMAVSLAFGVLFATFITLVLVPAIYLIFDDVRRLLPRRPSAESTLYPIGPESGGLRRPSSGAGRRIGT